MSSANEEEQMKKIYNDILISRDSADKPFIQQLRNIETNEDMKNYMFDTITQIEKGNL